MEYSSPVAALLALASLPAFGLDGQIGTHDPETVIECDGNGHDYGPGGGILLMAFDDGWTWRCAGDGLSALPGGRAGPKVLRHAGGSHDTSAWAPDRIRVGDRYVLYDACSGRNDQMVVALPAPDLDAKRERLV